jgi:DNA-binding CsgD family transcriptional regulator
MNRARKIEPAAPQANGNANSTANGNGCSVHPRRFVFFDKKTGDRRFEVDAAGDGNMPIDKAASLLAIQYVARQQMPRDFGVMVTFDDAHLDGLAGRAIQLMRTCSGFKPPVPLSRRQHEVLKAVSQNLSNKEIAAKLNVSVRTIKFHVSALLAKFHVCGRVDLMLQTGEPLSPEAIHKRRENPDRIAPRRPLLPAPILGRDANSAWPSPCRGAADFPLFHSRIVTATKKEKCHTCKDVRSLSMTNPRPAN